MTPQIFRGPTLAEARRAAEAALGEGAVMHTTRSVPSPGVLGWFGTRQVEISATPPDPDDEPAPSPSSVPPPPSRRAFTGAAYEPAPAAAAMPSSAPPSSGSTMAAMRAELRAELRGELRGSERPTLSQNDAIAPAVEAELLALRAVIESMTAGDDGTGTIARLLRAAGIEGKAAATLTRAIKVKPGAPGISPEERFRDAIADLVRVAPWPLADGAPALLALIGPSGVGKTTTAAKIAARAIIDHDRSVTFISCDGFRVGAAEQLRRYASLLDANFEIASTPQELLLAIENAGTDLVIVDTAGGPPTRSGSVEASLGSDKARIGRVAISNGRARHVLLCLPAPLRARDADSYVKAFAPCAPSGIVITKIDETRSPGGLVHATISSGLPVTTLCFGQRVPEDVAPATTGAILDYVVPAQRSTLPRRNRGK